MALRPCHPIGTVRAYTPHGQEHTYSSKQTGRRYDCSPSLEPPPSGEPASALTNPDYFLS